MGTNNCDKALYIWKHRQPHTYSSPTQIMMIVYISSEIQAAVKPNLKRYNGLNTIEI